MPDASSNPRFSALWASAFLLAGLVLVQFGRLTGWLDMGPQAAANLVFAQPFLDNNAHGSGGMVSQVGGYTVMTSEAVNEDLLVVLDHRNEELFVYRVENQNSLQLVQRLSVSQLFIEAKTKAQGRNPP